MVAATDDGALMTPQLSTKYVLTITADRVVVDVHQVL
jgi:hypothetical protein